MQTIPGVRYDRALGQYFPTINGHDAFPTSFDEGRALEIAQELASATDATSFTVKRKDSNNEKLFSYGSNNGTYFTCERADLSGIIWISGRPNNLMKFAADVAEMASFHAINVWPGLNSFAGYDCLEFGSLPK